MTDETSSPGSDQPRGPREQDERADEQGGRRSGAETGRNPEGQGNGPKTGPDATSDETGGLSDRLCGNPLCRRPLPEQTGRARRYEYCPEGTGPFEDTGAGTCKALADAARRIRAARGIASVPGEDELALAEDVTALSDLFDQFASRTQRVRTDLAGIGSKLDGDVATMRAERDTARDAERQALGKAASEERLRGIAEGQSTEAIAKQLTADKAAREAKEARTAAENAQRRAEQEQARLNGENNQLRERVRLADEAAERDRALAHSATTANTELTTKLHELTPQLADANARADTERTRADNAAAAEKTLRESLDQQIAEKVAAVQALADQKVAEATAAATNAVERLSLSYADSLQRLTGEHTQALAARDRRITAIRQALEQHVQQARAAVAELLRDSEPGPETTSPASERQLRAALAALAEDWTMPDLDHEL